MSFTHNGSMSVLRRLLPVLAGVGVALAVCVAASCGPTGQERYEQRLANTGKPALHGIQSARLRELMDSLTYSMTLDPPDRVSEPARQAKQIAEIARQMAGTARNIPDAVKDVRLSDNDREVLSRLAEKLRQEALMIDERASQNDYNGTDMAIKEMQSTCIACHTLFRMAGPLPR